MSDMNKTQILEAIAANTTLEGLDLSGVDLSGVDLTGGRFHQCNLTGANLSVATVTKT